jgi:hypothetical protein
VKDCTPFEEMIERRLHGALEHESAAALDEHLAGCPTCTRHLALATDTVGALHGLTQKNVDATDWGGTEWNARKWIAGKTERVVVSLVFLTIVVAAMAWATGDEENRAVLAIQMLVGGGIPVLYRAVTSALDARKVASLATPGELLAFARADLQRRIRTNAIASFIALPCAALVLWHAFASADSRPPSYVIAFAACGMVLAGAAGWRLLGLEPRLRRELSDLER